MNNHLPVDMKTKPARTRSPEQYDEEYQALQASLEDYLRQQMKLLGEAGRAGAGTVREESWFRRYRADVYFAVTLLLLGFLGWRVLWPGAPPEGRTSPAAASEAAAVPPPPASAPSSAAATASKTPPPPAAAATSKPPAGFEDSGAWWNGFVAANRGKVADWLTAVAEARGLDAGEVSALQKTNFGRWAAKVRSGSETDAERENCRVGLFEFVYGQWTKRGADAAASWGKVDLVVNPDEYPAGKMEALLAELGMAHWLEKADAGDRRAQNAVILGWLESRRP
jgi:hypothetical protein